MKYSVFAASGYFGPWSVVFLCTAKCTAPFLVDFIESLDRSRTESQKDTGARKIFRKYITIFSLWKEMLIFIIIMNVMYEKNTNLGQKNKS